MVHANVNMNPSFVVYFQRLWMQTPDSYIGVMGWPLSSLNWDFTKRNVWHTLSWNRHKIGSSSISLFGYGLQNFTCDMPQLVGSVFTTELLQQIHISLEDYRLSYLHVGWDFMNIDMLVCKRISPRHVPKPAHLLACYNIRIVSLLRVWRMCDGGNLDM